MGVFATVLVMNGKTRIATFGLGLVAIFAIAFGLGSAFEPADTDAGGSHQEEAGGHAEVAAHPEEGAATEEDAHAPAGLGVAESGYSLRLAPARMEPGKAGELRFRIEDAEGATVRDFDRRHERDMHLILVRRDGAHFQHLHPEIDAAGTWATPLTLPAAGVYRVFADFAVEGDDHTLASDLFAPGRFEPQPFPADTAVDRVDGYEVRLRSDHPHAGAPAALRFVVSKDGEEVTDLENYLGAKGHLVALREGDLAFLHVHPEGAAHEATFPTAARYRLYLQFKHDGAVRTARFTVTVPR